jgi:hypothetical protein
MKTTNRSQPSISKRVTTSVLALSALYLATSQQALAQASGVTATTRGVAGDMDKKGRDPQMTITRIVEQDAVRLLISAATPDKELAPYPIKFDFFVNRQLVSSQMTSPELPGDIGLVVPSTMATTPFNYSVVATVLHPNRQFTTVVHGAAFSSDIVGTLSCTAIVNANGQVSTYRNADVVVTQSANNQAGFSFVGSEQSGGESAQITASFSTDGPSTDGTEGASSGTMSVVVEGVGQDFNLGGTITRNGSTLEGVDLSNELSSIICTGVIVEETSTDTGGTPDDSGDNF